MKIGSLVVVLPYTINKEAAPRIQWMPVGDEKTVYTVRDIQPGKPHRDHNIIMFEEGVQGYNDLGEEMGMLDIHVREVQSPDEMTTMWQELKQQSIIHICP
jgi:hypothetical protein